MRVQGVRADGALWVSLLNGLAVVLCGDRHSSPMDAQGVEQLGPWSPPSERIPRLELANRLAYARYDPRLNLGDYEGHPFRGNQWTSGEGGGADPASVRERDKATPETAKQFSEKFEAAFKGSPFSAFVSHYTPDEIVAKKMVPISSPDGKAGMLVHDHGDGRIEGTALFNKGGEKGAGLKLLAEAIRTHGVNYVEAYGPRLPQLYAALGFETTEQYPFDRSLAAPDWDYEKFGTPDYHMMKLKKAA